MRTLIIFDTAGHIIAIGNGSIYEPVGVPFLWVDVPEGKIVKAVDVTVTPNVVIFEDAPKSEVLSRLELLEDALNEMLLG